MPAMITHYLLARRLLPLSGFPKMPRQDAFLLGAQGPDILYFHRAFPWQRGQKGFGIGNALHEVCPSELVDTLAKLVIETPGDDLDVVYSYTLGFLSHYAVDRMIHPYVCYWQDQMMKDEPTFAKTSNPYHYRIESALDTLLLKYDRGEYVSAFQLSSLIPKKDPERDGAIARFYQRLLSAMIGVPVSEKTLVHMTEDMRKAMMIMTDCTELKGKGLRFFERLTGSGANYSTLLRTKEIDRYDYANLQHRMWLKDLATVSKQDFYELCDETVAFAAALINGFVEEKSGMELTDDINFAGCRYLKDIPMATTDGDIGEDAAEDVLEDLSDDIIADLPDNVAEVFLEDFVGDIDNDTTEDL